MGKKLISRRAFVSGLTLSVFGLSLLGLSSCKEKASEEYSKDIIIVGAGGAGLISAISAYDNGQKDVLVLEKMPFVGGNTIKSSTGMNAAYTDVQKKLNISDSTEQFIEDTYEGGHKKGDMKLIEHLCSSSENAYIWLKNKGLDLNSIVKTAGSAVPRCHRPSNNSPIGSSLITTLKNNCDSCGIEIKTSNTVESLIEEDGKVVGCMVRNQNNKLVQYNTKCIILASGGFGANKEWIEKYASNGNIIKDFPTTNQDGATGDGIQLAQKVGADTKDMEEVQTHPTVHPDTHVLIGESMRGSGAIMVNVDGNRFYNEEALRDKLSEEELKQKESWTWLVFDQNIRDIEKFVCSFYETKNMILSGENVENLAKNCDLDIKNLENSIDQWNQAITNKNGDVFNRPISNTFKNWKAPYYAIKVTPGIHHTMGGLSVDADTHILRADGSIIPGLLGCGEVTGDLHGGNRLGGNSICDLLVNGITAGQKASEYIT